MDGLKGPMLKMESSHSEHLPSAADHYRGYSTIDFQYRGRVLYVKIAHEENKNAVDTPLHRDLARVFHDINLDANADVVVLTGSGRWFCAGGQMDWFQGLIDDRKKWREMIVEAKKIINGLLELEKPIIAKINGAAAGLGASIALLCDMAYISENAAIGDPHVKMGLVAGDGGAVIWPLLIGTNRAKELLFTGRMMSAQDAYRLGLVNHVVAAHELDAVVDSMANKLASGATLAIRWTKVVMNLELRRISAAITDAALAYETLTNDSADHQEAVKAFIEKRTPVFTGK